MSIKPKRASPLKTTHSDMLLIKSSVACLLLLLPGCVSTNGSYAPATADSRSPLRAQQLTHEAIEAIDRGNPEQGEQLLLQAIDADLYHGPAHNNLGVLYLSQGKLYEAASEFEWARKLMPGHPDPRTNLALTLERAGQVDNALLEYRSALEIWPSHMPVIQSYAQCQIRHQNLHDDLPVLLQQIALRGETEEWRSWAKLQSAKQRGTGTP